MIRSAASAAALALLTPLSAAALEKVTFGTNWVAQAEHGGYYQAVADGSYAACGLEVEIRPGGPQVNNRALMMAGKVDFFMGGNLLQPFNALQEDIPFVVVAAHFQKEPQVLMTHPGKVSKFEDIKGLGKYIIGDNGFTSYFQYFMTAYGFDAAKRVPYTFNPAPFIADPMSAQQGYVTSEPYAVEKATGWAPDVWLLADYGFSTYATTVETMADTIAEKPEVVKCFVEASSIGWATYLYGDASAADALIKKDNPSMTQDQIDFSRASMKKYGIVDSGDALELGIGGMKAETIKDFYEKMVAAGVLPAGLEIEKAYTLEFSNTGAALPVKKKLTGE